jgi:hypothetical protein
LITEPIAAGTADIFAPYTLEDKPLKSFTHRNKDVYPFIRALQLDGNPVHSVSMTVLFGLVDAPTNLTRPCIYKGTRIQQYIQRRPVLP